MCWVCSVGGLRQRGRCERLVVEMGEDEGEARMTRGQWSWLGLTVLHTTAWLVHWHGDGGERKAEEVMKAAGMPAAAQGQWCICACILRGERVVWSVGLAGLERLGHERHDG